MKTITLLLSASLAFACNASADENFDALKREIEELKKRVKTLEEDNGKLKKEVIVERLIVRKELIVSDTGQPWEQGFETQQIPRGIYARSLWDGPGGLWVRSRLIKGEIDDPSPGTFGSMARGDKWRSSRARDLSLPKCPYRSGQVGTTLAGSAFKPTALGTTSL